MNYLRNLILLAGVSITIPVSPDQPRVVFTAPVTDLQIHPRTQEHYAASPEPGYPVPRSYQALGYETARVIGMQDDMIQIEFDNMVYGIDPDTGKPLASFWVHKSQVRLISELTPEQQGFIPDQNTREPESTIILTQPFFGHSAGTRLVCRNFLEPETYLASMIHAESVMGLEVPRTHAQEYVAHDDLDRGRHLMIKYAYLMIQHAQEHGGEVPFVWGGASYWYPYPAQGGYQPTPGSSWERHMSDAPDGKLPTTYYGFDASGFLFRLANMSGIGHHYPCKTTLAAEQTLPALDPEQPIIPGDILWFKGYTILIAGGPDHEIIESRGYSSGVGKLHNQSLGNCFVGITNLQDLQNAYRDKRPLEHLDNHGNQRSIADWKILRIVPREEHRTYISQPDSVRKG